MTRKAQNQAKNRKLCAIKTSSTFKETFSDQYFAPPIKASSTFKETISDQYFGWSRNLLPINRKQTNRQAQARSHLADAFIHFQVMIIQVMKMILIIFNQEAILRMLSFS